jgi:hypothetical protein
LSSALSGRVVEILNTSDRRTFMKNSLDQTGDDFENNSIDGRCQRFIVVQEMGAIADDCGVEDDHEAFH